MASRAAEFLAHALVAENAAKYIENEFAKEQFLQIAASWRALAEQAHKMEAVAARHEVLLERRYVTRVQPEGRYCVYDRQLDQIAISPDNREYTDLSLDEALDLARGLNERESE
jgi:hypothetical protein